jgi:cell division protein FtsI/penicillin-binding protein 2
MSGSAPYPVVGLADPKIVTASYVGYLPADDPRYVILVKLDKPQTDDASWQAAAPVFANIAKQVVMITGLPPDSVRLSLAR